MENNFKVDFIGIGGAKCASTWVYRCLLDHPQICGPYIKETNYFLTKRHPLVEKSFDHQKVLYHSGIESYAKYFKHCKKDSLKGEISVSYFADPGTPNLIKKHNPHIRILVFLRDPVRRAFSHYWFTRKFTLKEKNETFEAAIKNNPEVYIGWSMYYEHLSKYYDVFPKENIGVFFVEDLKNNPQLFMKKTYEFLGVDSNYISPAVKKRENMAREVKFKWLRSLTDLVVDKFYAFIKITSLYFLIDILRWMGIQKIIYYIFYRLNTKKFVKPVLNPETEKNLRGVFREDIEKLELLLNKDLSRWK